MALAQAHAYLGEESEDIVSCISSLLLLLLFIFYFEIIRSRAATFSKWFASTRV